jgi:signal transduction histidine kinase
MKSRLTHKLTLAMVTLAVGGIILTGLLTNLVLSWNFQRYLRTTQEAQNRRIVETLESLYSEATSWMAVRRSTQYVGSTTGTQIRVFDPDNQLVADSLPGMMQGMHGRRWERAQEERGNTYTYPLHINDRMVGTVEITHLGQQGLWSGEALVFRRTLNQTALLASLLVMVAAIVGGSILSRHLTKRFETLTSAADTLGRGEFATRVTVEGDDELAALGDTMNRMAARLEEQNTLRKKLSGDISHELRTPLTTVQSYLEAFIDGVMEPDSENLRAILDETHRLGRLVNDLQELTTAECGDRDMVLTEVDLYQLVKQETHRALPRFKQKQIALRMEGPEEERMVLGDESLLSRVLGNLIINAYKYTPEGGTVSVSTYSNDESAGFLVADNGIGIPQEHLPFIFERFYRVDPSRTRATGGSGIGLAIVRELVRTMGGSVDVESDLGVGTTFRVTLQKPPR